RPCRDGGTRRGAARVGRGHGDDGDGRREGGTFVVGGLTPGLRGDLRLSGPGRLLADGRAALPGAGRRSNDLGVRGRGQVVRRVGRADDRGAGGRRAAAGTGRDASERRDVVPLRATATERHLGTVLVLHPG